MNIAQGSVEECRYYLMLTEDLGYGNAEDLLETLDEVGWILNAYRKSILKTGLKISDYFLLSSGSCLLDYFPLKTGFLFSANAF